MTEIYESLLDVPLDEHEPAEDGDDSLVPHSPNVHHVALLVIPRLLGTPQARVVAPYPGPLRRGSRNKGVRAINKGLAKAGFRRWQLFSFLFNRWTERALLKLLRAKRLKIERDAKHRVIYTREAHRALAPYFDAYDLKYLLLAPKPKPSQDEKERSGFLAELMYLYNHRYSVAYSQARPADLRKPPRALDCSSSGDWAAKHAGFRRSLSGFSSFFFGNTWSHLNYARSKGRVRESISSAKAGDEVLYGSGPYNPTHEAYYLGKNSAGVRRVWSFGSYPIKILELDYRRDRIAVVNLTGR